MFGRYSATGTGKTGGLARVGGDVADGKAGSCQLLPDAIGTGVGHLAYRYFHFAIINSVDYQSQTGELLANCTDAFGRGKGADLQYVPQ